MRFKITSLSNSRIKNLVRLRKRSERVSQNLILIEGVREVLRAVESGAEINEIYLCPDLLEATGEIDAVKNLENSLGSVTSVYEMDEAVFSKISFGDRRDGVLVTARPEYTALKDIHLESDPFLLVVEDVEKPGNLGAVLRSCDGAGVDAVLICNNKTDIYNPNVIRASLGTVFTNTLVVCSNQEAMDFLKSKNIRVLASDPQAEKSYTDMNLKGAVAFVVGREDTGLSPEWINTADEKIFIPMKGRADSLNVSVSTALLIYEALRQREG